jgi:hypothetical protein
MNKINQSKYNMNSINLTKNNEELIKKARLNDDLNREFKILNLNTSSDIDIIVRTWCAIDSSNEEQRFLGIMDHHCIKYLEQDKKLCDRVSNINYDTIRANRSRIIKEIYKCDANDFQSIMDKIKVNFQTVMDMIRSDLIREYPKCKPFESEYAEFITALVNKDKLGAFKKTSPYAMSKYAESLYRSYNYYTNRCKNSYSGVDAVHNLIEASLNLYNLLGTPHAYESVIIEFNLDTENNSSVDISFVTDYSGYIHNLEFPQYIDGGAYPLKDYRKKISLMEQFAFSKSLI